MSAYDPKAYPGTGALYSNKGRNVVAVAGTPQPIAGATFSVRTFTIQADPANTGPYFYVKDSSGNVLGKIAPGQSFTCPMMPPGVGVDLSQVQIDADSNGDGCFVAYV